jgi:gamma-glutamyltranspeptidase/glutathione hydrolase
LYYDAETKKIHSLNGSGRYPANVTLEKIRADLKAGPDDVGGIPMNSVLAVTVPGAAAGWVDTVEKYGSGKISLEQILTPAIELAEEGFPVSELSGYFVSAYAVKEAFILTVYSGTKANLSSAKPRPTSARSSRRTPKL